MEPLMVLSRLLEQTKRRGARAAEALYQRSDSLDLAWSRGSTGLPEQTAHIQAKVGVFLDEGRSAWCDLAADSHEQLLAQADAVIEQAVARAKVAVPSALAGPAERYDINERGQALLDRRQAHLGMDDRRDVIEDNVSGCSQAHPDLRVERIGYREQVIQRGYASTRGHGATERSTRFDADISARMGRSGRRHVVRFASRQFANIASMPFGVELAQRMALLATPAKLPSTTPHLILDAPAAAKLLRSLAPAFAAPLVDSGASFLGSCFGSRLAAPKLHIIDDPSMPGALLSRTFDDRGVPPAPVVVLREGVASGLYLDLQSARRANMRPTGHFIDGQLRPSNLVIRPGNRSRNALGMDILHYLVLTDFHDEQPVDIATGHLNVRADLLVYRDHELQGAVQGVPLSMPLADFLGAVVEISSDQARYSEVDACSLVLEGIKLPS